MKNVKTGARAWVNGELERMSPGLIDGYRDQIHRDGVDSDAYRAFEVIIHEQLDRCEAKAHELHPKSCTADIDARKYRPAAPVLQRLKQMTRVALCGLKYGPNQR